MSWAYRILRISISIVNIAVVAMVILAVYPFVTGDFAVDLPTQDDLDWYYIDGNLTLSAPVIIRNGGFYDVSDIAVTTSVENRSHYSIVNQVTPWGTIAAGAQATKQITFTLDLKKLVADGSDYMIFHEDTFVVDISISAKYALGLISFVGQYQVTYPWDGLILGMGFIGTPSLFNQTGTYGVNILYYLHTNHLLAGLGGDFSLSLSNGTGDDIAFSSQHVDFGVNYSDALNLSLDVLPAYDLLMNNQTLTAEITVRFGPSFQVTMVRQVNWVAPMHW